MSKRSKTSGRGKTGQWVVKWTVWNVKAKRFICRRDGQPFMFTWK